MYETEQLKMIQLIQDHGFQHEFNTLMDSHYRTLAEVTAKLEAAVATIKQIREAEHISIYKVRKLHDANPEFGNSQWVLYSAEFTDKYPTLKALLEKDDDRI